MNKISVNKKERYPKYLPWYYLIFLIIRKIIRQSIVRYDEKKARKQIAKYNNNLEDHSGVWGTNNNIKNPQDIINKPAFWIKEDLELPNIKEIVKKINDLKKQLDEKRLKYCSPAGTFIADTYIHRTEQKKLWENVWMIHHSGVKETDKVLDLGGASTIFSFYLASIGCDVSIIDNDWGNCGILYNSNYVAKKMRWKLRAFDRDLNKKLPFADNSFDRVFSICVVEHLPGSIRQFMMKEVSRVLKPGAIAGLTMDYDHAREILLTDKGLRFAFKEKLNKEIIEPSGLEIYGNKDLIDINPDENFLGALFLKK